MNNSAAKRILVLGMCAAVGGCATSPQDSERETAGEASISNIVAAVPEAEPTGPPMPAPEEVREVEDSSGVKDGIVASVAPVREIDLGGHRPNWWFEEAQWSEQRVTVCVEALGLDVLDARRESVRAAREALRELIGEEAKQGEIVLTAVKPLPVPAIAPSGNRYAGYVMITCVVEEGE